MTSTGNQTHDTGEAGLRYCHDHEAYYQVDVGCQSCRYGELADARREEQFHLIRNPVRKLFRQYMDFVGAFWGLTKAV